MTDRLSGSPRIRTDRTGHFRWKNVSGETIPAFACIKLAAYDSVDEYYDAVKPDGSGNLHFFNGASSVASGAYGGSCIWGEKSVIGRTTGLFGEVVGPVSGSWDMTTAGTGFVVFSDPENGIAAILKDGGSGSGGTHEILFYIVDVYCPDAYADACDEMYVLAEWTHYTGGCGKTPPGLEEYTGYVKIYDRGIFEYYTTEQLINGSHPAECGTTGTGMAGRATYWYPRDDTGYTCEPRWIVDSLIGNPECKDASVADVGVS